MNKKITILLSLLLALGLFVTGCGNTNTSVQSSSEVVVAVAAPLTGDYAQYGNAFKMATELKAREINEAGGINGKTLKLAFYDDKNDAKEAANIAQRLVDDKNILGVIGNFSSSASLAAASVYEAGGLVQFSPTSSHSDFTKQGNYMFRNINTQAIEAPMAANMVVNEMGKEKIAVIYINNDWGITAKDNFINAVNDIGGTIIAEESFIGGQTQDFTSILTKINGVKPDVIFVAAFYSETGMIAQQLQQLGYDYPLAGLSALYNEELIKLAGDTVEGLFLTTNFFPSDSDELVNNFLNNFKEAYGQDPDQFAAVAYDTLGMLAKAIEIAGEDRAAIRDELAKIANYEGVTGNTTFNENRDVIKTMRILQIQDGKFKLFK
ncbi:ABC transporter substrate-binding protein [Serpentinicella alkaliphila]|uniref:Amino acid/amide ABC transporter substrate-binding protein (HAAT family) n=1 Tax=Serpentinicella alkaliphila TaxID=1734049 RepID=A0A4R2T774_9FIRM|nr:ABC transporter substrate-binding protein [Serpentinicella alkaliphila]QUH25609.1 ABC transporter substrate-binding protein [Serpentinicella alkaliphila]TCP98390.1 amino acid/amide ABC transporter substrate-binding protein (HAAT family) [Serpentinicella alkaliphila]